jgi:uracil-DNA glycosylase
MLCYNDLSAVNSQLIALVVDPDYPHVLKKIGEDLNQQHLIDAYEEAIASRPKYGVKLSGKKGDMKFALLWSLKTDKSFDSTGIVACLNKLYSIKNLKDVTIVISEDAISKDAAYGLSDVDTWFAENCSGLSNGIKTNIRVHETPTTIPVSSSKPKSKAKVEISKAKVEESKEDVTPKAKVEDVTPKVEEPKECVAPKAKTSKAKVEVVTPKVEEPKEDVTPKVEEPEVTPNSVTPVTSAELPNAKLDDILRGIEELKLLVSAKNELCVAGEDDASYKWFYDEIFKTGFLNAQEMQGKYHHFYNVMMFSGYFDTEYAKEVAGAKVVLETVKQKQKEELKKEANAKSEDDPEFEDARSDDAVVISEEAKSSEEVVKEKVSKASTSMELSEFDDTDEYNWKNTKLDNYLIENPIESFEPFFDEAIDGGILDEPSDFLQEEAKNHTIFPPLKFVFRAFQLCRLEAIKVVLLGQDPYPTEGAGMGLSFSHFPNRKRLQPSLQKINKCLEFDGYSTGKKNGDLSSWATQGVLLLNTALTVRAGVAGSHASTSSKKGPWAHFTEALLRYLNTEKDHFVVFLWGEKAIAYKKFFDAKKHLIIEAPHPVASVYGGGKKEADFVEHRPFSRANAQLKKWGEEEIDWDLE